MKTVNIYQIPSDYFFRLHHVRPRFKNNVEEVLLYVATSIAEMTNLPHNEFKKELNKVLFNFKNNATSTQKTIDNWRTEISALFAFIQEKNDKTSCPGIMAKRLANNQYLEEFFNYFLFSFQYPGGHIKSQNIIKQIESGIKFKPCQFILQLLIEGGKLTEKQFYITAQELTQCAYFDLRVTKNGRTPKEVAKLIIENRKNKVTYNHQYAQLWNERTQSFPSKGDVYRYAGDMLDYMVLANLLNHKGTGYYYYLNTENEIAVNYHLQNHAWFDKYDKFYNKSQVMASDITKIEPTWFDYVNSFNNIEAFEPHLEQQQIENINILIQEYYARLKTEQKITSKIIGDYGENLILVHEYLRTTNGSKRQHLINKIPTHFGVGYDLQSIEIEKNKRYIQVKTTKSKKSINNNRFRMTPNEWDTAETLGDRYFIYYLMINDQNKRIFIIQNPVKQFEQGNLDIDKNFTVEFSKTSGKWHRLREVTN